MSPRGWARLVATVVMGIATLAVFTLNGHLPLDIAAGTPARATAGTVPVVAAVVAALAVARPRRAFLVVLALAPYWDMAQVSWQVGDVQVIAQTIFAVALALGVLLADRGIEGRPLPATDAPVSMRRTSRPAPDHVAAVVLAALLALVFAGTAMSPDVVTSAAVLLHGILEPVAMGLLLFAMRPDRRYLAWLAVALAGAVAIGGALDMMQSVPVFRTLAALQANRLLFSRLTFFNVGILGEMLAMAVPLLLAALIGRRHFELGRWAVAALVIALAFAGASLFLTFSKSAWLSTAGASLAVVLLLVRTWRRRVEVVAAAALISAFLIPWPALFLQVAPPLNDAYRGLMIRIVGESRFDSWNPTTLSGTGSLVERFYATRAAFEMAVDHPLLGIGLDRFGVEYSGRYKPAEAKLSPDSAHSMWAEDAAELGFPALFCVLALYALAAWTLWRVYRAPPDERTRVLAAAFLGALLAWLAVATAFAGDMYRPWRNMASDFVMMAVVVAAAFALYRELGERIELRPAVECDGPELHRLLRREMPRAMRARFDQDVTALANGRGDTDPCPVLVACSWSFDRLVDAADVESIGRILDAVEKLLAGCPLDQWLPGVGGLRVLIAECFLEAIVPAAPGAESLVVPRLGPLSLRCISPGWLPVDQEAHPAG